MDVKTKVFLCVDEDGYECICESEPKRGDGYWYTIHPIILMAIPKGTIRQLIGMDLTWKDEPFELTEEYLK